MKRLSLFFFLLLHTQFFYARLKVLDKKFKKIKLLNTREMRFCYISFVEIDNVIYLIKQKKEPQFLRKIVGVVRDSVVADIAENFPGIAHQVDVIPAGVSFPGKPSKNWPATIHTIAPGKMIRDQNSVYRRMNIQQGEKGFRLDMLKWMKKHPKLIIIIALDIFCSNHDRHRGNLFYNKKTDSFCGIDTDSSYKYNLCAMGCKNFTNMLNNEKLQLSNKNIKILIALKKYLIYLLDNYSSTKIVQIYDYFAEKAGFVPGSPLYTKRVAIELKNNKEIIVQSYQDARKLVEIMDKLIKKHQNINK